MKTILCATVCFISIATFANAQASNNNWPCGVKKCSKKDPKLNECLVLNANLALEAIFNGLPSIGVPNYKPYVLKNLTLGRNQTFKINFYDVVQAFGLDHMFVTNMNWDFKNQNISIDLKYYASLYIHGEYTSSGYFLNLPIPGKGVLDLIYVGGDKGSKSTYNMHYEIIKVLGKEYVQIRDRHCTCDEGFRMDFTDELKTKQQRDADLIYLNKHSEAAHKALNPEMTELLCYVIDNALNPFFFNFPLDIIFYN